jgi:hypothetical protein
VVLGILVLASVLAALTPQSSPDVVRIALAGRVHVADRPATPPTSYLCGTLTAGATTRAVSIPVGESVVLILAEPATLRLRSQVEPCGASR